MAEGAVKVKADNGAIELQVLVQRMKNVTRPRGIFQDLNYLEVYRS